MQYRPELTLLDNCCQHGLGESLQRTGGGVILAEKFAVRRRREYL